MDPAVEVFVRFLKRRNIANIDYVITTATETGTTGPIKLSIKEIVKLNYDKMDENCLRGMANEAVSEYNELKKQGSSAASREVGQLWSVIIDAVREVTAENQADAERNLTELLEFSEAVSSSSSSSQGSSTGNTGGSKLSKDKSLIISKCKAIYEAGGCTKSLMEIMINTRNACKENNTSGQMDGHILQLEFFIKCFTTLLLKPRSTAAAVTKETPENTYADSKLVGANGSSDSAAGGAKPPSTDSTVDAPVSAAHLVLSVEEYNQRVAAGANSDEDEDDDEEDEEDENENENEADGEVPILEMLDYEQALIKAGKFVQLLLKKCAGNVARLRDILVQLYRENATTPSAPDEPVYYLNRSALKRVLYDNVQASISAGYVNKRRVFELMLDIIAKITEQEQENIRNAGSYNNNNAAATGATNTSTYHAPQFIDHEDSGGSHQLRRIRTSVPKIFLDATKLSTFGAHLKNKAALKKKGAKREEKDIIRDLATAAGKQLEANGFVICEKFLPMPLVHQIRVECGLFQEAYEASEIWLGKEADVGAHLTVPSVRGDRVLWMCGAHPQDAAPEGITRHVQTLGEVEPCKLAIKAIAPIRKFAALKEFIQRIDRFVHELKPKVTKLNGVYERSDLMFSIYPGIGSRFQNHIDNTTHDGRVLTVVSYLNPDWDPNAGGALRVQLPQAYRQSCTLLEPQEKDGNSEPMTEFVDVFPECGRVVLFYSSEVRHEVLPTYADRHACTIWYYDKEERSEALKHAADAGKSAAVAVASMEAQTEARTFIAELMGQDESEDGSIKAMSTVTQTSNTTAKATMEVPGQIKDATIITPELLAELNDKVQNHLSDEALEIVSSITGAPSAASFKEGFTMLVPEDLRNIRQLFRRMGLNDNDGS